MGRRTCCFKQKLRKGLWSPEEDEKLLQHITKYGHGCWSSVPKLAGLQRCGKSCRLRWINYLRPDLKRGAFSEQEENLIIQLHAELGNRWSQIAAQLPGRTDNEIKNLWNSSIKKKLREKGIDPNTHKPLPEAGGEKSGTPSSSPDHARPSGPRNPAAGYFAVNYGSDNRNPPAGLTAEAGANSIFWFGQSSKAYDAGIGFDCGSISSVLPPVSSSMLSTSTAIRPMASLLQETSSSTCGGRTDGVHYWESGTSSNNSGTTGNSSSSSIELQTGTNFIHNPAFPWREYTANREPEHLPLEGELDELKWSDFLQSATMPPFPSPLAIHQSSGQNQLVLDELGNWQQMHRLPPPPPPLVQHQHDHQQQNPLLQVQNQDMYSRDLQRISAAFGQL